MLRTLLFTAAGILLSGCRDGQAAGSPANAPTVVDSIFSPAEATERFVRSLPVVSSLDGGAATAEALVSQIAAAVSGSDIATVEKMIVTRAEYGRLYYPSSVFTRRPYELSPDVAWLLNSEANAKGRRRLLERLGGKPISFGGLRCDESTHEGQNTIRKECTVELSVPGAQPLRVKLFHSVIERGGQVKILSLSGDY